MQLVPEWEHSKTGHIGGTVMDKGKTGHIGGTVMDKGK